MLIAAGAADVGAEVWVGPALGLVLELQAAATTAMATLAATPGRAFQV